VSGPALDQRRLLFVLGKGGTGKSTVAAAIGVAHARAGRRTLLVEVAGQQRLSRLFDSAKVGHHHETRLAPDLYGISIDAEHATEEYLSGQLRMRPLVELLTHSKAFHTFAQAAPGLAELVTMGKIWSLAIALRDNGRAPVWERLVVDCPATGHGIALLEAAGNVEDLAAGGPIRDQAARINEVVRHPAATGIAVVARPEELAVAEAVEAAQTLVRDGMPVAAAILNGVRAERFSSADEPALEAAAGGGAAGPVREAATAALRHLELQRADAGYRERIAATGLPVIDLPRLVCRRFDLAALEALAGALRDGASGNGRP
jgi:anion-transporting  ArsA/GET3 family ATPase